MKPIDPHNATISAKSRDTLKRHTRRILHRNTTHPKHLLHLPQTLIRNPCTQPHTSHHKKKQHCTQTQASSQASSNPYPNKAPQAPAKTILHKYQTTAAKTANEPWTLYQWRGACGSTRKQVISQGYDQRKEILTSGGLALQIQTAMTFFCFLFVWPPDAIDMFEILFGFLVFCAKVGLVNAITSNSTLQGLDYSA